MDKDARKAWEEAQKRKGRDELRKASKSTTARKDHNDRKWGSGKK